MAVLAPAADESGDKYCPFIQKEETHTSSGATLSSLSLAPLDCQGLSCCAKLRLNNYNTKQELRVCGKEAF